MRRILTILLLAVAVNAYPQLMQDTLTVYFRLGKAAWDPGFRGNGERMDAFINHIKDVQGRTGHNILKVQFHSNTSPEGTLQINERLGKQRAEVVAKRLLQDLTFTDSIVSIDPKWTRWDDLNSYLHSHQDVKYRDELMHIIESETLSDAQKEKLVRSLRGGSVWNYLLEKVFPDMRNSTVIVIVGIELPKEPEPEPVPVDTVPTEVVEVIPPAPEPAPVDTTPAFEEYSKGKIILKTNTIGWAMMISNVGVEYEHPCGLAFHLPIYYSAMNYFTRTLKFRTFLIQPEVRYYIPHMKGFFAGAHFGLAWYNLAFKGDWRYQDHGRRTPAIGGGLNVGYKMPLGKSKRWGMELSLGAGCYKLHYDKFINEQDGKYAYDEKRTFFGIDNAAVSFTYTFDLKAKRQK